MSSENPAAKRVIKAATERGEQVFRSAFEAGASAPSVANVAGQGAGGAADLARQVAGVVLRTAIAVGEQLVEAAGELESMVDQPREPTRREPYVAATGTAEAAALMLPSVSPGQATAKTFDVRNDGLDTIDAMTLRCDGLFGVGDRRIAARSIRFTPSEVHVLPRGTTTVECTVNVPAAAKRGTYTGLIAASGYAGVQLLVSLTVI